MERDNSRRILVLSGRIEHAGCRVKLFFNHVTTRSGAIRASPGGRRGTGEFIGGAQLSESAARCECGHET
jgi:hypothetical protein